MYVDTVVLASIAVVAGVILFASCFALFIWLDAADDEQVNTSKPPTTNETA